MNLDVSRVKTVGVLLALLLCLATDAQADDARERLDPDRIKSLIDQRLYMEARSLARELLAQAELTHGEDSIQAARALDLITMASLGPGKPPVEIREIARRSVAIRERLPGGDLLDLAGSVNLLGRVEVALDDLVAARTSFERALAIRERVLGPRHLEVGKSLNNLALVLVRSGDFTGGLTLYERVLELFDENGAHEYPEMSSVLNNVALLRKKMGDLDTARSLFLRVLGIQERALGTQHPVLAGTLGNLCDLSRGMGEYAKARTYCERALGLWEQDPGPESTLTAAALVNLGQVLALIGEFKSAKALVERALAIHEKLGKTDGTEVAGYHSVLAYVFFAQGDLTAARRHYMMALAPRKKLLGADHPDTLGSMWDLARIRWAAGESSGALEDALLAQGLARVHLRRTISGLSEREALTYEAKWISGRDLALTILTKVGPRNLPIDATARIWDELVRARAMVLDEMATRHQTFVVEKEDETGALQARLSRVRGDLSRLILAGPGSDAAAEYEARLRAAQEEEDRTERALASRSVLFRRQTASRGSGLEQIVASMPARAALLSYIRYDRLDQRPDRPATPSYLALVIPATGGRPGLVPLGAARDIDEMVRAWRDQAGSDPRAEAGRKSETSYRAAGQRLRAAIWDPVVEALGDVTSVFVVPDGTINLVNLATLPASGGRYLVETGPLLHYLSAERDMVRDKVSSSSAHGLLVLGDPDFDASPTATIAAKPDAQDRADGRPAGYRGQRAACGSFRNMRFEPLAGSRTETAEIESLWLKAAASSGRGADLLMLTGSQASETMFKRAAGGYRLLHIATHGFLLDNSCLSSPGPAETAGTGPLPAQSSLLLSGLALAGANRRDEVRHEADGEDGILTAEEIGALDLSGVEWAVMSACDTGVGVVLSGEGVLGLRRAFEVAGAGTLIMSLWQVEDDATRNWMRGLYESRFSGSSSAEAVRQASLKMIEALRRHGDTTHPFFWGGFVAVGDWR